MRFFALSLVATTSALAATQSWANPTDAQVTAGAATVVTSGSTLTINQSTPNAAINWQTFDIAPNESVRFNQPGASSIALNRVLGQDPSQILGSLSANGQVFVLNPNGVLFGSGAQVNVGGLVASTLDMSDQDFMAGRYALTAGARAGKVDNQGSITAVEGGYVALIAPQVTNQGSIDAPRGTVALAAGDTATLTLSGGSLLGVTVDHGTLNALVENKSAIRADGGKVLLTAKAMDSITRSAVNNSGVIEAGSISDRLGVIRLEASDVTLEAGSRLSANGAQGGEISVQSTTGTTFVDGVVEAKGASGKGGAIQLLGNFVGVLGEARIDASGDSGGGSVLIGGDYQGANANVQNAYRTFVGPDASIKADATRVGNGGKVVVWADDVTRFQGSISARGGAQAGDGGFVETSGLVKLEIVGGDVDTSAPFGDTGTWLLDPSNVTITAAGPTTGVFNGSPDSIFTPNQDAATIMADDLSAALANNNINITTTNVSGTEAGTITVEAPVTRSAGTGTTTLTLTPAQLTAGGTITIAASGPISGSSGHPLNVVLAASGVGATVAVGAPITTFGGNFSSTGTTFTNSGGPITTAGGSINLNHTTTMTLASPLSSGGGDIVIAGGSTFTDTTQIDAGSGTVTLRGSTNTLAIGVGSTTGTFNITQAQIADITAAELVFGSSTSTAAIHVGTNEVLDFGTLNVTFQNALGGITVEGSTMLGSGDVTFNAGAGLFANTQSIGTSGDVTIKADEVAIGADIAGNGKLTVTPFTTGTAIQVGIAPTQITFGAFNFTADNVTSKSRIFQVGDESNTGGITVSGPFVPGFSALYLITGGTIDIPLAANIVSAQDVVLAGSTFNNSGSASIDTPGGRWLVYSTSPADSTEGGLTAAAGSAMPRLYNRTFAANGPETIVEPGNHLIYSAQPTLTISATDAARNYGAPDPAFTYTPSGFVVDDGVTDNALTAGLAGSPDFTTTATSTSNVGDYEIDATAGSLTSAAGYGFAFVDGELTIDAATLTYLADPASRLYGAANPAFSGTVTGFQNGETIATATTGTLAFTSPAVATSNVGSYAIDGSGLTANNGNYVFVQDPSNATALTINAATLSYLADPQSRLYGAANPTLTGTVTGFQNGETIATATTGTLTFTTAAVATSNVGSYAIDGSGLTANNGNYVFVQDPSNATALTINAATLTYLADPASRVYGAANPTLTGTVSGFQNGETIAAATTGTLTFTTAAVATSNVGSYAIDGSGLTANNGNYVFVQDPSNATALTINAATLTYLADPASRVYGAANPTLTGTVSGFQNGETIATATTGTLTFTTAAVATSNVGSYAIDGSGLTANNGNYVFVQDPSNATALTINAATLSYLADPASRLYGAANPAFSGSVTGFQNGESIATATTGTLTFTSPAVATSNVGSYAIDGSGLTANNGNYVFVQDPSNATALTINAATLSYLADPASRLYGAANPALTGTVSGFQNGETIATATTGTLTFTTAAVATSNVGSYAIDGSGLTANNGNYVFVQDPSNATALTINAATLSYLADPASRLYGAANPAFSGSVTGFQNGESIATATTGTLTFTSPAVATSNVGSYAIDGSGLTANNGNYVFVQDPSNATALTINAATLSYLADPQSRLYGAANPTLTGTVTGFQNGETIATATTGTLTFTTAAVATSNVGSYAIDGSGLTANNGNYVFVQDPSNATALTIDAATLSYLADPQSRLYGAANPTLIGTVTGFQNGETIATATTGTLTFATAAVATSNVGSYAIDGSGLTANNGNYVFAQDPSNATALTINAATLSYLADPASRMYGDANPAFSGTVTGFQNGETIATATTGTLAFTSPAVATSNVGSYAIDGSGLTANNGNYVFVQDPSNATALTINAATLSYLADPQSRLYGAANPTLTGTVTGFQNGETIATATTGTLTFTTAAVATSNVGSYAIDGSGLTANNGNYVFVQDPSNATALTINAATLSYLADPASRMYGDANPAFSGTVTGFQNGETIATATTGTLAFMTPAVATSNVGSYAIDGSGLIANNDNYVFVQDPSNATALTITPRGITVTADDKSRAYGAANPALSYQLTSGTLVNGDVLSGTPATVATTASNVGTYEITQGTVTAGGNYTLIFADGILTITPLGITVTADSQTKVYGNVDPAFTYVTSGPGAGATLLGSLTRVAGENTGGYAILQGTVTNANNANYDITYLSNTLLITPRPLTVTADDKTKMQGDPNPPLTATLAGFALGEGVGDLSGALSLATPASETSPQGSYAITPSGYASTNYAIAYIDGVLVVTVGDASSSDNLDAAIASIRSDACDLTFDGSRPSATVRSRRECLDVDSAAPRTFYIVGPGMRLPDGLIVGMDLEHRWARRTPVEL